MSDYILFKDLDGKYKTLKDLVPEEEAADVDVVENPDDKQEDTEEKEP